MKPTFERVPRGTCVSAAARQRADGALRTITPARDCAMLMRASTL
jgi:hypothetical protein